MSSGETLSARRLVATDQEAPSDDVVPVQALKVGFSPRVGFQDVDHAKLLLGVLDKLPPVVVHRSTGMVIDGIHRLLAARMAGIANVVVEYFDGTDTEAYVEAVRRNIAHGKPLTTKERHRAATRILALHPEWSNRRVAQCCGLAPRTIAELREASSGGGHQPNGRVGKDGRTRPLDPAHLRERIAQELTQDRTRSIRAVARNVGTSPSTVLDVRERLARGESPVPDGLAFGSRRPAADVGGGRPATGDTFEDWFERQRLSASQCWELADAVPQHRVASIAAAASQLAQTWSDFATALERRLDQRESG